MCVCILLLEEKAQAIKKLTMILESREVTTTYLMGILFLAIFGTIIRMADSSGFWVETSLRW